MFNVQCYQLTTPLPFGEGSGERLLFSSSFPFSPQFLPTPVALRCQGAVLRQHRADNYSLKFAYIEVKHKDEFRHLD